MCPTSRHDLLVVGTTTSASVFCFAFTIFLSVRLSICLSGRCKPADIKTLSVVSAPNRQALHVISSATEHLLEAKPDSCLESNFKGKSVF